MERYDVIVIGGGPAGCASALFLSRRGYRVVLLDQARFPRDKVCGEFISPAADAIFEDLGILSSIESLAPIRLRGVCISSYEREEFMVDYPPLPGKPNPVTSLSLSRYELDHLLIRKVREAGIPVREGHKVTDFILKDGKVTGVRGRDDKRVAFSLGARVVVDAGGRNSISLRRFKLRGKGLNSRKIALAAHWKGTNFLSNYCYMHISSPGYTGISRTGKEEVNVVLVVDRNSLEGENPSEFYQRTIRKNPLRRGLLGDAAMAEKVRTVDSLSYSVKFPRCGGLVLAGDALGFIDPFTGEGIYLSLRSAQLAAPVIDAAFRKGDFSSRQFLIFEKRRRREFNKKFLLSQILQRLIHDPFYCNWVVKTLGKNPDLAQELVGVIGDYVPVTQVVSFKFLIRLLTQGWGLKSGAPGLKKVKAPTHL
ncbi:MAG: NAD(P)/FAD-dependent oxidoreductase [Nitrospinaceae bacterium]